VAGAVGDGFTFGAALFDFTPLAKLAAAALSARHS